MKQTITIAGATVYETRPDDGKKHPGLIIIEEVWGVNDHIKSVCDRFAAQGYNVLSPELLPEGLLAQIYPGMQKDLFDPEKRNTLQPKMREMMAPIWQPEFAKGALAIVKACVDHLLADENVNGNVGVMGFCFGGTYSFQLAAHDPRIKMAMPFYGQPPSAEEIPQITCPILAFYGAHDERLAESLPALKENMAKNGKKFEAIVYPDAGHAFFNDTNRLGTHNPDLAQTSWERTVSFLRSALGS